MSRPLLACVCSLVAVTCSSDAVTGPSGAPLRTLMSAASADGPIAFTSERDGNGEIYVREPDGSGQENLSHNFAHDAQPAWSPDGTTIAFYSERNGDGEIYVMNADGSAPSNLTNSPASNEDNPAWSPDGTRLAFMTERDNNAEIYVMNADGSGQTNLTNAAGDDRFPAWSPDGTKIAFMTSRAAGGNGEIYVMDADGSDATPLTNHAETDYFPAWSPDGTQIAFTSNRDGNFEIYVMNADGSAPTNLTNDAAYDDYPAWSPDGTKIAFTSDRGGSAEIYVMNADGTDPISVTNHPASDYWPSWGPPTDADTDSDGVNDAEDNCPSEPNRGQSDLDGDGIGDACEVSSGAASGEGTVQHDGASDLPGEIAHFTLDLAASDLPAGTFLYRIKRETTTGRDVEFRTDGRAGSVDYIEVEDGRLYATGLGVARMSGKITLKGTPAPAEPEAFRSGTKYWGWCLIAQEDPPHVELRLYAPGATHWGRTPCSRPPQVHFFGPVASGRITILTGAEGRSRR